MREILDNSLNPYTQTITLCTGAQLGKSTLCLLILLLLIKFQPGPALWLLPTDTLATRAVKKRVLPLLKCNDEFRRLLPPPKESNADSLAIKGFPLYYTGVRTPAKLASIPARYLIMDESAKFEHVKKDEADPVSLAKERVKSFSDPLIIQASTPNIPENQFWQSFLDSSQAYWWMPCFHCGEKMIFEWGLDTVKWEEGKPLTAKIYCPHCKHAINDDEKMWMIKRGEWVHSNNEAKQLGRLGYHLNSLYSPYVSIGEMALKYVEACHSLNKNESLRNFTNSWLALPYTEYISKIYDEDIRKLINPMVHRGIVPLDYEYLVTCFDVGQNETHSVTCAYLPSGKLQIVDWTRLVSYSSEKGLIGPAKYIDQQLYELPDGSKVRADFGYIDSGWATNEIYNECMRTEMPGILSPSKGVTAKTGSFGKTPIRSMPFLDLITYSDFQLKRAVYLGAFKEGDIVLPSEADDELIKGLSGQELVKTRQGQLHFKEVAEDHYGDCVKLCYLSTMIYRTEKANAEATDEIQTATTRKYSLN